MTKEEGEYAIIKSAVRVLCVVCGGNEKTVITMLTGYLWDEEEAGGIARSDGCFHAVLEPPTGEG